MARSEAAWVEAARAGAARVEEGAPAGLADGAARPEGWGAASSRPWVQAAAARAARRAGPTERAGGAVSTLREVWGAAAAEARRGAQAAQAAGSGWRGGGVGCSGAVARSLLLGRVAGEGG